MKKIILSITLVLAIMAQANAQTSLSQGGTGWGTSTAGDILVGTSSKVRYTRLPIGTTGKVLQVIGGLPSWVATSTLGITGSGGWTFSSSTIWGLFTNIATGLTYNNATGETSLTSGYIIPLSASTTNWNNFWNTPSTRITAGANCSWSLNTFNCTGGSASPLSTKGDLWGYTTTDARVPVGANGTVLMASSTSATGLAWSTVGGSGTVTSVDMTVPTGLTVSGNPVTGAGTLALGLAGGYVIPLSASTTQWSSMFNYGTSTFLTSSSLTPYMTLAYGSSTYMPLASSSLFYLATNPSGYITSSALSPYMPFSYASTTYMPLASSSLFYLATNPSGYITNSVSNLTNYPTYTYASSTFASTTWINSTFPSFSYASSTFASTSWVINTFAPKASPTFTGKMTFVDASSTGVTTLPSLFFTTASGTGITATHYGNMYPTGLSNAFLSVDTTGKIIATTTPGGTTYTGTYPIIVTGSVISSGFSTSTINSYSAQQTFVNASATTAFSTPLLYVTGLASTFLAVDPNGKVIATTTPTGGTGSGNSAWTIGSGSIYNATSTDSIGIATSTFNTGTSKEILKIDCGSITNDCLQAYSNVNSFHQILSTNMSTGINASAGFTAENSISTPTSYFAWLGINGTGFATSTTYDVGWASDVSLIGKGNNMFIASASSTGFLSFLTGGTATTTNTRMTILSNGNVGIATATPSSLFNVSDTLSVSTSSTGNILDVASSTGTIFFGVTQNGHIVTGGNLPTVGTCGTSPTISGTDRKGKITMGTAGPTACTVTFNKAYVASPICVVSSASSTLITGITAISTTAFTIGTNLAATSVVLYYICEE